MKTSELKTDYWKEIRDSQSPINHYDDVMDTFFLYFSQKEDDVIVSHFVDDCVAFLYRRSDRQVIGMRIEYFTEIFLPTTAEKREWKLSATGKELDGLRDLSFRVEKVEIPIIKPIPTPRIKSIVKKPIEKSIQVEPVFA